MTIKELISLLKKFPEDAVVYLEGCDCINESKDVEEYFNGAHSDAILINADLR